MDPLGVALIGSGYIADYHARGLRELAGVEMRALCSLDGKEGGPPNTACGAVHPQGQSKALFG